MYSLILASYAPWGGELTLKRLKTELEKWQAVVKLSERELIKLLLLCPNLYALCYNIQKLIGNIHGLRTWIEYKFKQCKDELGWTDYRLTRYAAIQKWWEIIMGVYLMVSFQSEVFQNLSSAKTINSQLLLEKFQEHP